MANNDQVTYINVVRVDIMCVCPCLANNDQVTYINMVRVDIMCVSTLPWQTITKLLTSMWLELI